MVILNIKEINELLHLLEIGSNQRVKKFFYNKKEDSLLINELLFFCEMDSYNRVKKTLEREKRKLILLEQKDKITELEDKKIK